MVSKAIVGKKYLYNGDDWFAKGSIITITRDDGTDRPPASGPARVADVGHHDCAQGEAIEGYARLRDLEEINGVGVSDDYSIKVENGITTLVFQKSLSVNQIHDVLAAAGL